MVGLVVVVKEDQIIVILHQEQLVYLEQPIQAAVEVVVQIKLLVVLAAQA